MREALNGFVIRGISSNIPFQSALLAHPKFVAGDFNTGFIAEEYPEGLHAPPRCGTPIRTSCSRVAAAVHRRLLDRAALHHRPAAGHEMRIGEDVRRRRAGDDGRRARDAGRRCARKGDDVSTSALHDRTRRSRSTARCATRVVRGTLRRRAVLRAGRARRPRLPRLAQRRAHRGAGAVAARRRAATR